MSKKRTVVVTPVAATAGAAEEGRTIDVGAAVIGFDPLARELVVRFRLAAKGRPSSSGKTVLFNVLQQKLDGVHPSLVDWKIGTSVYKTLPKAV